MPGGLQVDCSSYGYSANSRRSSVPHALFDGYHRGGDRTWIVATFLRFPDVNSEHQLPSSNGRQRNRETCPLPSSCEEDKVDAPFGLNVSLCTIKDVARFAPASTVTVSRVVNGSGGVSGKTTTRVLTAISELQFFPRRARGGIGTSDWRYAEEAWYPSARTSAARTQIWFLASDQFAEYA